MKAWLKTQHLKWIFSKVVSYTSELVRETCGTTHLKSVHFTLWAYLSFKTYLSWVPVAHTYTASYFGGWDWEDHSSRPTLANSWGDPISKITRAKWTGGVAKALEHLFCKCVPWVQTQSHQSPSLPPFLSPHTHKQGVC
jgi:hypothetical protein